MSPAPESEDQVALVTRLREKLAALLGDRGGGRHSPPWEPRQNVVIGVLEPRFIKDPPADPAALDDTVAEDSKTATESEGTNTPNATDVAEVLASASEASTPSLGLDFLVTTSEAEVNVEVDLAFAIYLEEYPTLQEQLTYLGATEQREEPTKDSAAEAQGHQRSRAVSVLGAWRRHEISLPSIHLSIPLTGDHAIEKAIIATQLQDVIESHFAKPEAARPFPKRTRTISSQDLTDKRYAAALKEAEHSDYEPQIPAMQLTGFVQVLGPEKYLVSVSLTNVTVLNERSFQDLSAYDCRIRVQMGENTILQPQKFELAPADYRYSEDSTVWARGNGCVAYPDSGGLRTTTLPFFRQRVLSNRTDHVPPLMWADLATNPNPILDGVEASMRSFLEDWDSFLASAPEVIVAASETDRNAFEDEIRRFRLGRRAMRIDPRLNQAFLLANEAFAETNASKGIDSWHLFQLVYLVCQLPALASREHRNDQDLARELEYVDVLWVPTGGGKTEAYLGLILVSLFYDRLRGKHQGTSAWLKFPLRMLSVQQLSRVLEVVVTAETLRNTKLDSIGQPFELGYLVGGDNTPNKLRWEAAEWWPGFDKAVGLPAGVLDERRLVAQCPYCGAKTVGLDVSAEDYRLKHVCRSCSAVIPIYMTDDEVYRYLPSVIVGTVDKLTGFAFFGEFTQFTHGPRWRCPDHGGFSFRTSGKCLAGDACARASTDYAEEPAWYDPVPALIIQDEMHLIREELGAFDAHYEGLLVELQRSAPHGLPSKILAASATVEQFEDQLRQIYGRRPRSFPTPGFDRDTTFYLRELEETRREYVGVLPHYRRKADVAGIIQRELLAEISDLQDELAQSPFDADLLFNYEVSLAYVNAKPHGDQVADELRQLSDLLEDRGGDRVGLRVLTGQVKISELAEPIDRIQEDTLAVPRAERIRALVGTSVVSHGVDLQRLNVMVMAGLPSTVADYIQATSRSGRTHTGLVVTVFDSFSRRERSTFMNFMSFHKFLGLMVEPAPVNKYAYFGADRTLPGIVMALLWDLARRSDLDGPPGGVKRTRDFQPWWNTKAPTLKPLLVERLNAVYRAFVPGINERLLEDELVQRVLDRWEHVELPSMQRFDADNTTQLFREKVLTSFRDVDEAVEFDAKAWSAIAFEALTGDPSGTEVEPTDAT